MSTVQPNMKYQTSFSQLLLWTLLASCLLFASACSKKRIAKKAQQKQERLEDQVMEQVLANAFTPKWFKAKTKIGFDGLGMKQQLGADIRIRQDSLIWMTVYPSFVKLPLAYALITPDSIKVIDRFGKKYYPKSIDYVEELVGYPIDFHTLQDIILGQMPTLPNKRPRLTALDEATYQLAMQDSSIAVSANIDVNNYTYSSMKVQDQANNRQVNMKLDDYQAINDKLFAYKRKLRIYIPDTIAADINFSKVETPNKALKFPFPLKASYERIE